MIFKNECDPDILLEIHSCFLKLKKFKAIEPDIRFYTKMGEKRPLIYQCCSVTQKEQPFKLKPVE